VTVASEREGVLAQPGGAAGASFGGRIAMSLAQSTRCLSSGSLATKLAMLLLGFADPLNSRIAADGGVGGIDHDHFVVLVGRILTNPIGVEHAKRSDLATNALLGDGLERALEFHLVDTVMSGFAVCAAFSDRLLAGTAANAHAVNDETLLGAVTQATSLFDPGWLRGAVDSRQLPVLPGSNAKKEPHDVSLLFTPQLVHVFVRPHFLLKITT